MATMKLYELVNHYHIGTELTCAEAVFMACNEYYHLNLSEETRKMFSVMGLGMQTEQSCCGAFTVAVGIIGLMTGISIGFAAWGRAQPQPDPWRAAGTVQVVQSGMPAAQETG